MNTSPAKLVVLTPYIGAINPDCEQGLAALERRGYWGEARAPWSFNGTGTVGGPPPVGQTGGWLWTGTPNVFGVTAPTGWAALPQTAEDYGGPSTFYNNQLQASSYTASATG